MVCLVESETRNCTVETTLTSLSITADQLISLFIPHFNEILEFDWSDRGK